MSFIPVWSLCKKKCSGSVQWNGSIRFFIEAYLDLIMSVAINLKHADWQTPFPAVQYSNILSIILFVLIPLLSVLILVYYFRHRETWTMPEFHTKFNTLLEDFILIKKNKWQVVATIALFMLKRVIFVIVALFMSEALSF